MNNGMMMENFFGMLKTLDNLIKVIDDYINYYNFNRIKVKIKGLSPVNYRLQSSNQNY